MFVSFFCYAINSSLKILNFFKNIFFRWRFRGLNSKLGIWEISQGRCVYLASLVRLFRRLSTYFIATPDPVGGGGVSFRNNRNNRNKKTKQTQKPTSEYNKAPDVLGGYGLVACLYVIVSTDVWERAWRRTRTWLWARLYGHSRHPTFSITTNLVGQ